MTPNKACKMVAMTCKETAIAIFVVKESNTERSLSREI